MEGRTFRRMAAALCGRSDLRTGRWLGHIGSGCRELRAGRRLGLGSTNTFLRCSCPSWSSSHPIKNYCDSEVSVCHLSVCPSPRHRYRTATRE